MTIENRERLGHDDSPEAIKAEIEQTRAEMSSKIDTIQARLHPDRLKVQAQDAAKEILHEAQGSAKQVIHEAGNSLSEYVTGYMEEGVHSMTDYIQNHREEIGQTVVRTVKRNPLPAALIGLGLGWLFMSDRNEEQDDRERRRERRARRYRDHDSWEREMLYGNDPYSERYDGGYDSGYDGGFDNGYNRGEFANGFADDGSYAPGRIYTPNSYRSDMNYSNRGDVQPGAEMLYRGREDLRYQDSGRADDGQNLGERVKDTGRQIAEETREMGEEAKERIQETGKRMEQRGKEAIHRGEEMGRDVAERIQETGHEVRERVEDVGHELYERAQDSIHNMQEGAQRMGERMAYMRHEAEVRGSRMGRQLHRRGRRAGRDLHHGLEENPLTFSMVAFAAGAALAMFLPQTRTENRMLGEYRDEFMEQARDVAQTTRQHAQRVYEDVRPEVEQGIQHLGEELREVSESTLEDVKQTAHKAAESTRKELETSLEEVDQATQVKATDTETGNAKAKHDSGKQSGSSHSDGSMNHPMNADIFKGQWKELRGELKQKWGKLTDDDMTRIEGDYDKFIGQIQTRYGMSKAQAEKEAEQFFANRSV